MRLILTRHGETEENKKGIHQGHLPGTLSKEGIKQAKLLAKRLKKEKIDVIYSSDLKRAKDTTKEIIKFHKSTPVHYTKHLREGFTGKFQGMYSKDIDWSNKPKDAETRQDIVDRVKKLLDKVYQKHKNKTVLFVSHGGPYNGLLTIIFNRPAKELATIARPKNTSICIFKILQDKAHKVHCLNCIKHLKWI